MEEKVRRMVQSQGLHSVAYTAPALDAPETEWEIECWGAGAVRHLAAFFGPALESAEDGRIGWWPTAAIRAAIARADRQAAATSVATYAALREAARADTARQAAVEFARAAGAPVVVCRQCQREYAGRGYGHQDAYCAACHASITGAVKRVNAHLAAAAELAGNEHVLGQHIPADPPRHGYADDPWGNCWDWLPGAEEEK